MGQQHAAADELQALDRKALTSAGDPLLLVAELLLRADEPRAARALVLSLARGALQARPEEATLALWRAAYPPAYRDEVERWAREAGVPADLLMALMREESGLDPRAVSAAGAVGLTQLMLPTAQGVAKKLRLGRVDRGDLMRPPVAIRIGAAYLGGLLQRYAGSEPLALAAYNAGEGPVKGWLRARGSLPLDAFVEEIPIQETRGYVKRVLRSYAVYRFLYGGDGTGPLLGQGLPAVR
jgi:soluble lytic murein transglycosylase